MTLISKSSDNTRNMIHDTSSDLLIAEKIKDSIGPHRGLEIHNEQ